MRWSCFTETKGICVKVQKTVSCFKKSPIAKVQLSDENMSWVKRFTQPNQQKQVEEAPHSHKRLLLNRLLTGLKIDLLISNNIQVTVTFIKKNNSNRSDDKMCACVVTHPRSVCSDLPSFLRTSSSCIHVLNDAFSPRFHGHFFFFPHKLEHALEYNIINVGFFKLNLFGLWDPIYLHQ